MISPAGFDIIGKQNWRRRIVGPLRGFAKPLSRKTRVSSNLTVSAFARHSFSDGGIRFHSNAVCIVSEVDFPSFRRVDLKDRIKRHQKGQVPATKDRLPVKLISYFAFSDKYTAFNFEKYLKSGSGRAFIMKHKLIYN